MLISANHWFWWIKKGFSLHCTTLFPPMANKFLYTPLLLSISFATPIKQFKSISKSCLQLQDWFKWSVPNRNKNGNGVEGDHQRRGDPWICSFKNSDFNSTFLHLTWKEPKRWKSKDTTDFWEPLSSLTKSDSEEAKNENLNNKHTWSHPEKVTNSPEANEASKDLEEAAIFYKYYNTIPLLFYSPLPFNRPCTANNHWGRIQLQIRNF